MKMPNMLGQPMGYSRHCAGQAVGRMPEVAYSWAFLAAGPSPLAPWQSLTLEAPRTSQGHVSQPPDSANGRASQGQTPHAVGRNPERIRNLGRAIRKPTGRPSVGPVSYSPPPRCPHQRTPLSHGLTHG
jgi:hypothetical protein